MLLLSDGRACVEAEKLENHDCQLVDMLVLLIARKREQPPQDGQHQPRQRDCPTATPGLHSRAARQRVEIAGLGSGDAASRVEAERTKFRRMPRAARKPESKLCPTHSTCIDTEADAIKLGTACIPSLC
ncbi:hypothetical protein B0T26DRAFT_80919 [Lasiosphaeria miniovina]|uniref:Uncharacterized protein n=1 Tax=Lasiosphaeria miniovina TaxID=1954250 RepID=A0AA40EEQ1_9PEZI|nr:uncharacterized protein B0T26DRAFT_80919 [Lasiosphaeria miniovina]KAK0734751.1 hypothetical protein B0T26DRAFT_80919 [Lasiosphaeria miniovina]